MTAQTASKPTRWEIRGLGCVTHVASQGHELHNLVHRFFLEICSKFKSCRGVCTQGGYSKLNFAKEQSNICNLHCVNKISEISFQRVGENRTSSCANQLKWEEKRNIRRGINRLSKMIFLRFRLQSSRKLRAGPYAPRQRRGVQFCTPHQTLLLHDFSTRTVNNHQTCHQPPPHLIRTCEKTSNDPEGCFKLVHPRCALSRTHIVVAFRLFNFSSRMQC